MKYKLATENFLKELFFESWMDENDWNEFLIELKIVSGITIESMAKDIETGVINGYSIETQMAIVRKVLENLNNM